MSVKLEKLTGCKVKLDFDIDSKVFDQAIDEAFEKKVVDVEIRGFRKGKVPREVFNLRFGEESLYEEAMNIVINDAYLDAIRTHKLEVVNRPEINVDFSTLGKGKNLKFTIEVEVWPEVELGQYKELEVEKESTEVTEKDVDEYIERIRKNYAELVVVEDEPLKEGHTAVFDFEGFVDGEAFEGGKSENYSLEIGSGQFIPGFEEQMVGMNTGEEKTIEVTFPEEYHAENLKGKKAEFKIKLHEIKRREIPELNDEFVKELEIENVSNVEEYKKFVTDVLEKEKKEASENKFSDDVLTLAVNNAKLDIPNGLVEEEIHRYVHQVETQANQYQIPVDTLLKFSGIDSLEQYKEAIKPTAEMNVKQRAVFLKIAEVENLEMTDEDYDKELDLIATELKKDLKDVKKVYSKDMIAPYVRIRKAIDLIKSSAVVK
ncbi:MAG TPA: trigger factor [Acholeplasmataceae bacterium]|jgi:trigger factor|nr:trigger factor [Acholeplasmataceae bacterium]